MRPDRCGDGDRLGPAAGEPWTAEDSVRLVAAIQEGDASAEERFVRRFQRPILAAARARTRDPEAARDLAQDALLAVLLAVRAGRVREPAKLAAFTASTTRNLAGKLARSRRRAPLRLDDAPEPAAPADPEADATERARVVEHALCHLRGPERTVLELTYLGGLEPREIAARLHLSAELVRARKCRALRKAIAYVRRRRRSLPPGPVAGPAGPREG
jgi:RNA polymerase sigma factor (sigma-70 family)